MSDDTDTKPKRDALGHFLSGADWDGNRKGRPPGPSLLAIMRRKLDEASGLIGEDGEYLTVAEAIVRATLADAVVGDAQSRKLVWEYVEGKARQSVEVSAPGGGPLQAEVTIADTIKRYATTFEDALGEEPGEPGESGDQ